MRNFQDVTREGARTQWLTRYYFARAAFSAGWIAAALTLAQNSVTVAATLLVLYPAWDAAANFVDASRSGGLSNNRTQAINVVVSLATTLAVVVALGMSMNWVLGVFGLWAIFSGVLQLGTGVSRWKANGGQWAMILSGGQSALAGAFFIAQARMPEAPSINSVTGYAGFGAFYFLVSAISLSVARRKARGAESTVVS